MKKDFITGGIGAAFAGICSFWGGLDIPMQTLLIFMGLDYLTGLLVAGVFKKSPKTEKGALDSKAGFLGLLKKSVILLAVLVANRLDAVLATSFVEDAVILAYLFNESISLIENFGLMGVYIPEPLKKAIELLKGKDKDGK